MVRGDMGGKEEFSSFDRYKLFKSVIYTLSERRMRARRGLTGRGQKRQCYEVSLSIRLIKTIVGALDLNIDSGQ
jgi:hypothetical protein